MTLLSVIQGAADLLSLARPSAVVSSADQQIRQLYALANVEGGELAKRAEKGWQALLREATFVTVATETQSNAVPSDLDFIIPDTVFNRTQTWQLYGPLTASDWQSVKANDTSAASGHLFRVRGDDFLLTPTPSAGETIAYEYSSLNWAKSDASVGRAAFMADTDGTYLSEHLITLGVVWRFKHAKGLDYGEDMETYERAVQRALGRDGGATAIAMAPTYDPFALNIPRSIPV